VLFAAVFVQLHHKKGDALTKPTKLSSLFFVFYDFFE